LTILFGDIRGLLTASGSTATDRAVLLEGWDCAEPRVWRNLDICQFKTILNREKSDRSAPILCQERS